MCVCVFVRVHVYVCTCVRVYVCTCVCKYDLVFYHNQRGFVLTKFAAAAAVHSQPPDARAHRESHREP